MIHRKSTQARRITLAIGMAALTAALTNRSTAQPTFTVVAIPDTQYYSQSTLGPGANFFDIQTNWVVGNRISRNIVFATHLGDVVNIAGAAGVPQLDQWNDAVRAMNILRTSVVPFAVLPGNHDWTDSAGLGSIEHYRIRFGDTSGFFTAKPWFLGFDARGTNSAQRFSTPIGDMLHLALEWNFAIAPVSSDRPIAPADAIAWAQAVIDAHPGLPTIVSTHNNLNGASQRDGAGNDMFDRLVRRNNQIFMVLNGHYSGEGRIDSINDFGHAVYELCSDYQSRNRGGDGWLRLYEFAPADGLIRVRTYTPIGDAVNGVPAGPEFAGLGRVETDADSQFDLPIDFNTRFLTPAAPPSQGLPPHLGGTVTLRRGLNGYNGVQDTEIRQANPTANFGSQGYLHIDTDDAAGGGTAGPSYGLIRFDGLFGDGAAVPNERDVLNATLRMYVHPSRSNSEGAGFELRRMLVPWSQGSNWDQFVQAGSHAGSPPGIGPRGSSGYEAVAHPDDRAGGNAGSVGVRSGRWVELDVTRSLLAWREGAPQHGWLVQTYPDVTNAVRLETSESAFTGQFWPELIITRAAGIGVERVFTHGEDTVLDESEPTTSFAAATSLNVDASVEDNQDPAGSDVQSLIRFADVFGSEASQVPSGARISSAVLMLHVNVGVQFHAGTSVGVHRMLRPWTLTETWANAGEAGGITLDNIEAAVLPDDQAGQDVLGEPLVQAGVHHFDVTRSVRAWAATSGATNFGWVLAPTPRGTNAILFDSFESGAAGGVPPSLTVRFVCPADVTEDGAFSVQDIFAYLAAWFGGDGGADMNSDAAITVQDLFDFLAAWFAGC